MAIHAKAMRQYQNSGLNLALQELDEETEIT